MSLGLSSSSFRKLNPIRRQLTAFLLERRLMLTRLEWQVTGLFDARLGGCARLLIDCGC